MADGQARVSKRATKVRGGHSCAEDLVEQHNGRWQIGKESSGMLGASREQQKGGGGWVT